LETALREQKRSSGRRLGAVLCDLGFVRQEVISAFLAEETRTELRSLRRVKVEKEVLQLVPVALARRLGALPLSLENGQLTVAMADAWKVTPLVMLILLAGLQAIPRELYEAARTDGAGLWQQFWRITLPLLRPALTMVFIIRGVDAFRIFALPLALVGRHLPVLSTFAYVEYLEYGNPHTSAASSTLLLVMILMTVGMYLRLAGPEEVVR